MGYENKLSTTQKGILTELLALFTTLLFIIPLAVISASYSPLQDTPRAPSGRMPAGAALKNKESLEVEISDAGSSATGTTTGG